MTQLPIYIKHAILEGLAAEKHPKEIASAVKERFGLNVSYQHVAAFYPSHKSGAKLSFTLAEHYAEARARFVVEQSGNPRLYLPILLRELERAAELAEARGNYLEVVRYLERVAVEIG